MLERWDRRNQDTAEYHNETAPDIDQMARIGGRFGLWYGGSWVAFGLLGVVLGLLGFSGAGADTAKFVIVVAVTGALIIPSVAQARRKRVEWKRDRAQT